MRHRPFSDFHSAHRLVMVLALAVLAGCATHNLQNVVQDKVTLPTCIHQEVSFRATPKQVYDAILDTKQFGAVTGFRTEISPEVGGPFSCFNGIITGRNIELVPDQRIVQAWRDRPWSAGVYSIVKFDLKAEGPGTRLVFDHTGF